MCVCACACAPLTHSLNQSITHTFFYTLPPQSLASNPPPFIPVSLLPLHVLEFACKDILVSPDGREVVHDAVDILSRELSSRRAAVLSLDKAQQVWLVPLHAGMHKLPDLVRGRLEATRVDANHFVEAVCTWLQQRSERVGTGAGSARGHGVFVCLLACLLRR